MNKCQLLLFILFKLYTLKCLQYDLLHADGSSHGCSRLTRRGYDEECYAALMEDAHKEWQVLEKASGQSIYV